MIGKTTTVTFTFDRGKGDVVYTEIKLLEHHHLHSCRDVNKCYLYFHLLTVEAG